MKVNTWTLGSAILVSLPARRSGQKRTEFLDGFCSDSANLANSDQQAFGQLARETIETH